MTNKITAVLVGGPCHGVIYQCKPIHVLRVPAVKPIEYFNLEYKNTTDEVPIEVHNYTRETLSFFGQYLQLYFHDSISDNGTSERNKLRGKLVGELLINDLGKTLLREGPS